MEPLDWEKIPSPNKSLYHHHYRAEDGDQGEVYDLWIVRMSGDNRILVVVKVNNLTRFAGSFHEGTIQERTEYGKELAESIRDTGDLACLP